MTGSSCSPVRRLGEQEELDWESHATDAGVEESVQIRLAVTVSIIDGSQGGPANQNHQGKFMPGERLAARAATDARPGSSDAEWPGDAVTTEVAAWKTIEATSASLTIRWKRLLEVDICRWPSRSTSREDLPETAIRFGADGQPYAERNELVGSASDVKYERMCSVSEQIGGRGWRRLVCGGVGSCEVE